MSSPLPVPLEFELPNQRWRPVPPEALGVRNALFLAARGTLPGRFVPTISISGGLRTDGATLDEVADESVLLLGDEGENVALVKRQHVGDPASPGITQLVSATVTAEGQNFDVRKAQVLLSAADERDPDRRMVLTLTLTAAADQLEHLMPEFQSFTATVRAGEPRR